MNTHTIVADIRQDVSKLREGAGSQVGSKWHVYFRHFSIHNNRRPDSERVSNFDCREVQHLIFVSSLPGELPPPPPRIFFGRDELIERSFILRRASHQLL
jgi:hypothetical protein